MTAAAPPLIGIYDFELFPYALGDVLTWNVRTAMRCIELGREKVDIYLSVDERSPAGIYQRGLINPHNHELFFSELYGAFGTHPRLGNIHIFRDRDTLLERLQTIARDDAPNAEAVSDYFKALEFKVSASAFSRLRQAFFVRLAANTVLKRIADEILPQRIKEGLGKATRDPHEAAVNEYFVKYIHSHEAINEFAARHGGIPLLAPALGCGPDIDELVARRFAGKAIVPFHLRLRRLDAGYGGGHSYDRDSDFLEWYDFLREAGARHPDVEFVALGRLQEKPLELLRLPNVTSLRVFGMGLGHELTLMLKSDLFIGTSSGFAAFANFCSVPYFITKMNPGSCHAYAIPEGADRLPFATDRQKLVYAQETSAMLMSLLEEGLGREPANPEAAVPPLRAEPEAGIDLQAWLKERSNPANAAATTSRFYADDRRRGEETAFLLLPALERARATWAARMHTEFADQLARIERNFPSLGVHLPEYLLLKGIVALDGDGAQAMECLGHVRSLRSDHGYRGELDTLARCLESRMSGKSNGDGAAKQVAWLKQRIKQVCFDSITPTGVATPEPAWPREVFSVVVNSEPRFEGAGQWGPGFSRAVRAGQGVEVGPGSGAPNVFAQPFAALPGEPFMVLARAASARPGMKGRLQINWHSADDIYLATSMKVLDLTEAESTFEYQAAAPAGAAKGVLYVTPHGDADVVRYTEMTLLKMGDGND